MAVSGVPHSRTCARKESKEVVRESVANVVVLQCKSQLLSH